jgi:hypothetical protein
LFLQANNATNYLDLPEEVIPNILRYIPQRQRLTQCALVCQIRASAASLATVHVEHNPTRATLPAFQEWLHQHAGQLLSLRLSVKGAKLYAPKLPLLTLSLPINKLNLLQHLELTALEVVLLCDADGSAAHTGLVGRLQHLDLKVVHLEDVGSLEQLTSSSNLTCLALESLVIAGWHFDPEMYELCIGGRQYKDSYPWPESDEQCETVEWVVQPVPGILQRLPRLSVLRLPGIPVTNAAVWQLEALQGLRDVTIQHIGHDSMLDLHHLPGSLTRLCFYGQVDRHPEHPTELPQQVPPNLCMLQSLSLVYCDVPPTLLGSVTPQLLDLRLEGCLLLPYDDETDEAPTTEGTAALLDALPRFASL